MNNFNAVSLIKRANVIFWDFDGVIKNSVPTKTKAFEKLFISYGNKVTNKVIAHHKANGGVSRYKKIPYYFKKFVGVNISKEETKQYYDKFSEMVVEDVIKSPWIPGVEDYLRINPHKQTFIIVTGTPQDEIEFILKKLNLYSTFTKIYGAPNEKYISVNKEIKNNLWKSSDCILIGDSSTDYKAAKENNIEFIFRGDYPFPEVINDSKYFIDNFSELI